MALRGEVEFMLDAGQLKDTLPVSRICLGTESGNYGHNRSR